MYGLELTTLSTVPRRGRLTDKISRDPVTELTES